MSSCESSHPHGPVSMLAGPGPHGIFHLGRIKSDFSPQQTLGREMPLQETILAAGSTGRGEQFPVFLPKTMVHPWHFRTISLANLIPGLNAVLDQMICLCQSRMLTLTSTPLEEQFVIREIKQVNQIGLTPLNNLTRCFLQITKNTFLSICRG